MKGFSAVVVKKPDAPSRIETVLIHLGGEIRIDCGSSMSIEAVAPLALAVRHGC